MKAINKLFLSLIAICLMACSGGDEPGNTNPEPENQVVINVDQLQFPIQKNVSFSVSTNNVNVANINWFFGDGTSYYGNSGAQFVYHSYENPGPYTVKVEVVDQQGNTYTKTRTVTAVNTNLVKINKINVQSLPRKYNCRRFVVTGISGYWTNFVGDWDESESFGTNAIDKKADLYLNLSRNQEISLPESATEIQSSYNKFLKRTGFELNEQVRIFDVAADNIILSLSAINHFEIEVMDYDTTYSLVENGTPDELISSISLYPEMFQGNSIQYTEGDLQVTIEFERIN
ncbi:hypothetical protein GV828_07015 [Flavobacterium sp. NST-5]|uniref:PKD domain-containing protein n=1 Tax=Flavobacterium ichthyis TaxID=2698827 RepID=A0ABW9ZCA4_9FLAO|nr:PKD domain-containing protein [Flavobacterium ichthyis]NBL64947.1 hypothetical protein [Flavobacterium ichthyis]